MERRLAALEARMATVDLAGCSDGELRDLTSEANRGQRQVAGYLARLAAEARAREQAGGSSTAEDLIRSGGDVSRREAEQVARRADLVKPLPVTGQAALAGDARPANLDLLARELDKLTPTQQSKLALQDDEIAEQCRNLPPETFQRYLQREIGRIRRRYPDNNNGDEPSEAEKQKAASRFDLGRRSNGRWWLSGDLDDERGSIISHLINQRARDLAGEDGPTSSTRAAALFDLIARPGPDTTTGGNNRACGQAGLDRVGGTRRMAVGYIVDALTLAQGAHAGTVAQTWDGDDVDPRAAGRIACDADLYAILIDRCGTSTGVGRTRRAATREQRLALRALYDACPLDGTPFGRCEIHHVNVFFDDGGLTDLDNLLPLSPAWHHRIHDRGWTLSMAPDRTLALRRPDGTLERTISPPTPLTRGGP